MNYTIKSHPTFYKDVLFRSRLEARWAAFFDLAGWEWEYEPVDLEGWSPDFRVSFPCGHSECNGNHVLLVEVKPYFNLESFAGHQCLRYPFGFDYENQNDVTENGIPADASAAFGSNPFVTEWQMCHGAGGGVYTIADWIDPDKVELYWKVAGSLTQYKPAWRRR
jgi:hypothetical protein